MTLMEAGWAAWWCDGARKGCRGARGGIRAAAYGQHLLDRRTTLEFVHINRYAVRLALEVTWPEPPCGSVDLTQRHQPFEGTTLRRARATIAQESGGVVDEKHGPSKELWRARVARAWCRDE